MEAQVTAEDLLEAIENRIAVLIDEAFDLRYPENAGIRLGSDTTREDLLSAIRQGTNLP